MHCQCVSHGLFRFVAPKLYVKCQCQSGRVVVIVNEVSKLGDGVCIDLLVGEVLNRITYAYVIFPFSCEIRNVPEIQFYVVHHPISWYLIYLPNPIVLEYRTLLHLRIQPMHDKSVRLMLQQAHELSECAILVLDCGSYINKVTSYDLILYIILLHHIDRARSLFQILFCTIFIAVHIVQVLLKSQQQYLFVTCNLHLDSSDLGFNNDRRYDNRNINSFTTVCVKFQLKLSQKYTFLH